MESEIRNDPALDALPCTAIVLASAKPKPAPAGAAEDVVDAGIGEDDVTDVVSRHSANRIANELSELTQEYPIRHGKRGSDHLVFIRLPDLDGNPTWMEAGEQRLDNVLRAVCYRHFCKGPTAGVVEQVVDHIRGRGLARRAEPCARRVHADGESVWVSLGPGTDSAVRITANGWSVDRDPPVLFTHAANAAPLPEPVKGGSIQLLRKYLPNVRDEDWPAIVGFIVATLQPHGGYPILVLQGAQGVGKSVLTDIIRGIVDPVIELDARCALPTSGEDLNTVAGASHLLSFDNCSGMDLEISDGLCRISTGTARQARRLYSQGAVHTLRARNPIILNGITAGVDREDLLSRSICIELQRIPVARKRSEFMLRQDFARDLPLIVGALFDAISMAIRDYRQTEVVADCRLADAVAFVTAAEPALGFADGVIVRSWMATQEVTQEDMHGADPVVAVLNRLFKDATTPKISWTAADWVQAAVKLEENGAKLPRDFPRTANTFGAYIKRREGVLQRAGYVVSKDRSAQVRRIGIERVVQADSSIDVIVKRPSPGQSGGGTT